MEQPFPEDMPDHIRNRFAGEDTNKFDGIQVSYSVDRLRQIGHLVSAKKGREFGTDAARALLLLYGQDLIDRLDQTVRTFLEEKLS